MVEDQQYIMERFEKNLRIKPESTNLDIDFLMDLPQGEIYDLSVDNLSGMRDYLSFRILHPIDSKVIKRRIILLNEKAIFALPLNMQFHYLGHLDIRGGQEVFELISTKSEEEGINTIAAKPSKKAAIAAK
jgi:hypothetical protein